MKLVFLIFFKKDEFKMKNFVQPCANFAITQLSSFDFYENRSF